MIETDGRAIRVQAMQVEQKWSSIVKILNLFDFEIVRWRWCPTIIEENITTFSHC